MKMLKKMAALLLAGVMAMALLTACGDDTPVKSAAEQAEDAILAAVNVSLGSKFENNADLQKAARNAVATYVDENGLVEADNWVGYIDEKEDSAYVILPAGTSGNKIVALGLTSEQVASMKDPAFTQAFVESFKAQLGSDFDYNSIKAMGVGAVTKKDGKTYIAFAMSKVA